ncbi:PF08643 family protein [Leptospira fainei serovar Hurstbridge str. BUT 6]|uniref:PF08643 family protein n=1 Tax=Leptospira fainei serovar Hurstbridge str. BUT 6 TaxID=1193011 RepID=S3V0E9_9LEPT|nr:oxidoreductase [Leptospira fainei]EPG74943.1 PF08643 family protein [Leptospira fainei serovar Hurstbridge str. BUT 6]
MVTNKVVLITGASSGIGKATAEILARNGFIVYGAARRLSEMDELKKLGGHPIQLDVTDAKTIERVIDQIIESEGKIDVLINNAGFGLYGSIEDTSIEDAKYQFEVNIFGLAKLIQSVIPHMRKQGSGKIINISSVSGKTYAPLSGWYHASKHAVEGLSDCLRLELKPFGIDVVIIEPGLIDSNFNDYIDPLLKRSSGGAYDAMANKIANISRGYVEKGRKSSPKVIATAILDAINSSKPKRRYAVGRLAKPILFIRRWLGDGVFDKLVMRQYK